jgi:hypothetical protein
MNEKFRIPIDAIRKGVDLKRFWETAEGLLIKRYEELNFSGRDADQNMECRLKRQDYGEDSRDTKG